MGFVPDDKKKKKKTEFKSKNVINRSLSTKARKKPQTSPQYKAEAVGVRHTVHIWPGVDAFAADAGVCRRPLDLLALRPSRRSSRTRHVHELLPVQQVFHRDWRHRSWHRRWCRCPRPRSNSRNTRSVAVDDDAKDTRRRGTNRRGLALPTWSNIPCINYQTGRVSGQIDTIRYLKDNTQNCMNVPCTAVQGFLYSIIK